MEKKYIVFIPIYNQAGYINKTIDSVLNQSESFDEVVISDNHSTDGLREKILNKYDGLTIISPPAHLKMNHHWRWMVDQRECDYFMVLSADDWIEKDYLKNVKRIFNDNIDIGLIVGSAKMHDIQGRCIKNFVPSVGDKKFRTRQKIYELYTGPNVSFASYFLSGRAYKSVGGFKEELDLCADWALWISIVAKFPIIKTDSVVGNYRYNYRPNLYNERMTSVIRDELVMQEFIEKLEEPYKRIIDRIRFRLSKKIRLYRKYAEARREVGLSNTYEFTSVFKYRIGVLDKLIINIGLWRPYLKLLTVIIRGVG